MEDDELKNVQELALAINARMDALVAHADALRKLLDEVGATHQAVVAQFAHAHRRTLEQAVAAVSNGRPRGPLRGIASRSGVAAGNGRAAAKPASPSRRRKPRRSRYSSSPT